MSASAGEELHPESILTSLESSELVAIATFDRDLRYVRVSPALAAINGLSPREHLGRSLLEVAPHIAPLVPHLREVLATGAPHRKVSLDVEFERGVLDLVPILQGSDVVGVNVVVADVTSRDGQAGGATVKMRAEVTELATRIARATAEDAEEVARDALRTIADTHDLDRVLVCIVSGEAMTVAAHHSSALMPPLPERWPVELFRDLGDGPLAMHAGELARDLGARSLVAMPLRENGRLFALAAFCSARDQRWGEDAIARFHLFGELLATMIRRVRAERAVAEQRHFEEQLAALSTRFVAATHESLDGEIVSALRLVAELAGLEQAFLVQREGSTRRVTYEWSNDVPSFTRGFEAVRMEAGCFPHEVLAAGHTCRFTRDDPRLHPHAALTLQQLGIASTVLVPLRWGDEYVASIGLHAFRTGVVASDEVVTRLRLVGETIVGALARRRSDFELRRERERALATVTRQKASIERERDYLREELRDADGPIFGRSPAIVSALERVDAVAETDATVLLRGETGVGKELFARAVHERSTRRHAPLVRVNCASISPTLFESEFFGHVRGAFTGAHRDRVGRFELADGGTLFLDEVGEIPLDLQAKLLRVLQEGELERIGDDRTRRVDVRVVAATNRDLEREVVEGRFRSDLYYRLSVFPIDIPPLRDRRDDIVPLARMFLAEHARSMHRELSLAPEDEQLLLGYEWPGNVRELRHVIERAAILAKGPVARVSTALANGAVASVTPRVMTDAEATRIARDNLVAALERCGGQIGGSGGAAELLGVAPSTLRDRLRVFGLKPERRAPPGRRS